MTRKRLNKAPSSKAPAPLKAVHSAVRPTKRSLDGVKVAQVSSLCHELGVLPPRFVSATDAGQQQQLVDLLLTPSPARFRLLCEIYQTFCPELKTELEELKPALKKTLEETQYLHILDFVHDAGIFDDGDEADLAKIKGDISNDEDHLDFWLSNLQLAKLMEGYKGPESEPKITAESLLEEMENLTESLRIFSVQKVPDAASLVTGPLAVHLSEQKEEESNSYHDLKKVESKISSELKAIQDCFDSGRNEEEEEDSLLGDDEDPPESLVDEEALNKLKLLRGNAKDYVNTLLMKYDLSLKNAVEGNSRPDEVRGELEDLLEEVSRSGDCIRRFVGDVDSILDSLQSLRDSRLPNSASAIRDLKTENEDVLALNVGVRNNNNNNNVVNNSNNTGPGVFDDFFKDL